MTGYTDDDIIPFGKFKGVKMCNIPAWYLLSLYKLPQCDRKVWIYISDNLDVLRKEVIDAKK